MFQRGFFIEHNELGRRYTFQVNETMWDHVGDMDYQIERWVSFYE